MIRARQTIYNGVRMRSRLEAAFAQWLDSDPFTRGSWSYEPTAYASADGQYLPDFVWFNDRQKIFYEVKPHMPEVWDDALARMHIVLASAPDATLEVVTSDDYETFQSVRRCTPDRGCGHCDRGIRGALYMLLDYQASAKCGQCGHEFTHLHSVDTYDARPPENRLSAHLTFCCEDCDWLTVWQVEQVKGETFATFKTSPGPGEEHTDGEIKGGSEW